MLTELVLCPPGEKQKLPTRPTASLGTFSASFQGCPPKYASPDIGSVGTGHEL